MARSFRELRAKMNAERRVRVEKRVQEALKDMPPEGKGTPRKADLRG